MDVGDRQEQPIAKLNWHAIEEPHIQTQQFTAAFVALFHRHDWLISEATVLSNGCGQKEPEAMYIGMCDHKDKERICQLRMHINGNTQVPGEVHSDVDLCDSCWHHFVIVYDAVEKTETLYVDGALRRTIVFLACRPVRMPALVAGGRAVS